MMVGVTSAPCLFPFSSLAHWLRVVLTRLAFRWGWFRWDSRQFDKRRGFGGLLAVPLESASGRVGQSTDGPHGARSVPALLLSSTNFNFLTCLRPWVGDFGLLEQSFHSTMDCPSRKNSTSRPITLPSSSLPSHAASVLSNEAGSSTSTVQPPSSSTTSAEANSGGTHWMISSKRKTSTRTLRSPSTPPPPPTPTRLLVTSYTKGNTWTSSYPNRKKNISPSSKDSDSHDRSTPKIHHGQCRTKTPCPTST